MPRSFNDTRPKKRRWVDRGYAFSANAAAAEGVYNTAAAPSAAAMGRARGSSRAVRSYGKRSYAWKRSRLAWQRPSISNLCETAILRVQGIKQEQPNEDPDDATVVYPGFYPIGKGNSAITGDFNTPVYSVDLTRVANATSAAAVSNTVTQLYVTDAGQTGWADRGCQNSSGATQAGSYYQLEKTNGIGLGGTWQAQYVQTLWYDIRIKMYGARKQTVCYDVMLVRFTEDGFCPGGPNPTDILDLNYRNQMYSQFARAAMVNTILPGTHGWSKYMKVIRRARHVINPNESTELDRNPDSVDLKWFVKDTRVRSHYQLATNFASDQAVDNVGWIVEGNGQFTPDPEHQKSRLFLFIRATDMTPATNLTTDDQDDTPSFDLCVRKKIRVFPPTT